jgi:DNA-binding response OmpR family regulator
MKSKLLLVEDDEDLGAGLKRALELHHYKVCWEMSGAAAINAASSQRFSACVLDLGLPDLDGGTIIPDLRHLDSSMPILALTARDALREKVRVLNLGADDYIVKPVELDELVARLQAVSRRAAKVEPSLISIDGLVIATESRSVTVGGRDVSLTTREFDVLFMLAKAQGKVVARETIHSALEKWSDERDSNIVDVHIHNIRKKIGSDYILTIRGIGYMMK